MTPKQIIFLAIGFLVVAIVLDILATRAELNWILRSNNAKIIEGKCVVIDKNTCVKMENPVEEPDSK